MNWDVVIIGAGPAGSTLAIDLAHRDLQVLLVDQSEFPRSKVCGGCLNGNAISALKQLKLDHLLTELDAQPFGKLKLMADGNTADVPIDAGMGISRSTFDYALIQEAVRCGAAFRPGVRMTLADGHQQGRIVVLAHGLKQGTVAPRSRIGAGVVLESSYHDYPRHTIGMAIGTGGYVGDVRVENGRLDLAAAFDPEFVRRHGTLGKAASVTLREAGSPEISGLELAPWKGTPMLTRRPRSIAGERWFAVGDAAGYVEPFTGEGMAWAMNGALALAPIVQTSVQNWDESHARLWTRTHARLIARRQLQCRILSRVLRSQVCSAWLVRALAICPTLARPFVRGMSQPTRGVTT